MATALTRMGHEVEVVTGLPNYPMGRFFDGYQNSFYRKEILDGVVVHRLWMYPALGGGLKRVLNYGTFAAASLIGMLRAKKPDYLFVESPPLSLSVPGYFFSRFWKVPLILNISDLWPDTAVEMGFISKDGLLARGIGSLERWAYRKAAQVNAVTQGMRNSLLKDKSVPSEKVLFLPNGVDTGLFQPRPSDPSLRQRLGLQDKKIIIWAGTLGQAHGLQYVLQAAKLLEVHTEIHFLFLGDGTARPSLERLRLELKLNNVSFRNPVPIDMLPPYFSIAECGLASLCSSPLYENARPSKVFPVLASGKPLIFVGRGEAAGLIKQSNAGIVVPPENPEVLADAVLRLVKNPELVEELGQNGRRFVESNFQWSQIIEKWLLSLKQVNSAGPAGRLSRDHVV
jgi:glycosyltransferase involved in cell wall biosynthesis